MDEVQRKRAHLTHRLRTRSPRQGRECGSWRHSEDRWAEGFNEASVEQPGAAASDHLAVCIECRREGPQFGKPVRPKRPAAVARGSGKLAKRVNATLAGEEAATAAACGRHGHTEAAL